MPERMRRRKVRAGVDVKSRPPIRASIMAKKIEV